MKRKSIENGEKQSTTKHRNTDSETLIFLQEKTKSQMVIRQQEIELRRKKLETNKNAL